MTNFRSIADIRREYGDLNLSEQSLPEDPIVQFKLWFEDVLKNEKNDPTAMVLSTVDNQGLPDSRVVLLKGLEGGNFVFYTNYQSKKAKQIQNNPYVALNFYWPQMARQVRIRGQIKPIDKEQSDLYFSTRPIKSQYSAIVSPQSHEIEGREALEKSLNDLIQKHGQEPVLRPTFWGGYMVIPDEIEFWQGRDNRLHDRIHYYLKNGQWTFHRLAP
ncbi:pyridoxamine 5'-phosphate oxidase [Fluoribacter gormanii]|uniref:Pyridoxine/pyridoxamine 5'-phosphate oxidase n=1 Tax=Fluoribacter gormanii TaxID=464 RepID=A0A377GFH3_9GAMM|nr:pyridoxamine 5'-phosphate oxidase [Fluoribacter gormanii]KTD01604.1 pyridoxine 5'-phosphate oxidase [Fluoribacter gormanii]MCW8444887.1 pyridoxamine 5'-phosphate oxidase [Fluoribacter gormanii]MCW8470097.1 pyridoxamine 5'-phosphate oxidase [Fluoribacter gormanii]SIR66385.1 Pyridoxamine 5'-phosphate oxidase [Fluoribacter gormanii]STO23546.1 Pyridoxine/pyridoxamine 5'-phosphate oxidase [Fluoribacter gormanii]